MFPAASLAMGEKNAIQLRGRRRRNSQQSSHHQNRLNAAASRKHSGTGATLALAGKGRSHNCKKTEPGVVTKSFSSRSHLFQQNCPIFNDGQTLMAKFLTLPGERAHQGVPTVPPKIT